MNLLARLCALLLLSAAASSVACSSPASVSSDAGRDAGLECATPLSIVLSPSTSSSNPGVPSAGLGVVDGECALFADELQEGAVLAFFDLQGAGGTAWVAARVDRWVIETSSLGSGPTTYIANLPEDTDIALELTNGDSCLAVRVRVSGATLTLLEMRRL